MELFFYLFQVNCALIVFYSIYYLLLRHLTFYSLNRYFILFSIFFAFVYPLVDWKAWLKPLQSLGPVSPVDWNQMVVAEPQTLDYFSYLKLIFVSVAIMLMVRLLIRLASLFVLHRNSQPATWHLFNYRHVFRRITPFSFWKNIYIHSDLHEEHEMRDIMHHESIHVNELHTFDVLLGELVAILNWFNPVAWFFKKSIQENLEFLTDQRVIRSGVDKKAYQMSLLQVQKVLPESHLGTAFNIQYLKRRIKMMNKRRSSSLSLLNYLVSIPSIIVFVLIFTVSKAIHDPNVEVLVKKMSDLKIHSSLEKETPLLDELTPAAVQIPVEVVGYKSAPKRQTQAVEFEEKPQEIRIHIPPKNPDAFVEPIDFFEIPKFTNEPSKKIFRISVNSKGSGNIRKTDQLHEYKNSDQVDIAFKVDHEPITITVPGYPMAVKQTEKKVEGKLVTRVGFYLKDSISQNELSGSNQASNSPYVIVDGQENLDLSSLETSQIESVSVFKSEQAISKYGDKAKHGLILISTKKNK